MCEPTRMPYWTSVTNIVLLMQGKFSFWWTESDDKSRKLVCLCEALTCPICYSGFPMLCFWYSAVVLSTQCFNSSDAVLYPSHFGGWETVTTRVLAQGKSSFWSLLSWSMKTNFWFLFWVECSPGVKFWKILAVAEAVTLAGSWSTQGKQKRYVTSLHSPKADFSLRLNYCFYRRK